MKIKKNDNVVVIAGNSKGSTGKVLKVFPKQDRVIIEGVNLRKRHTKPNQANPQPGLTSDQCHPIFCLRTHVVWDRGRPPWITYWRNLA